MERFPTLFFVAGLGCFAVAAVLSLIFPFMTLKGYHGMDFLGWDELAAVPSTEFRELAAAHPAEFQAAFGEVSPASYAEALRLGRDVYVGQACWHCHSQYVRVVSNEEQRFGPPSSAQEFQNELSLPHLWGTRRVGPDLGRERGKHTNDWQIAHLINPKNVVPTSVMPPYAFYFEEDGAPKREGFALVTYLQWVGTTYAEGQVTP